MYTAEQIETFAGRLRRALAELGADVGAAERERADAQAAVHGEPHDRSAESSAEAADEVRMRLGAQHRTEMRELQAALQRIEDGSFGQCIDCGRDVGLARLEAHPAAARCVPCQERREGE